MIKQFHLISTGKQTSDTLVHKLLNIHQHVDYIHIREKAWSDQEIEHTIRQLISKGIAKDKLILNGNPQIAVETGIKGVQMSAQWADVASVKQRYPDLLIGCSIHNQAEAIEKEEAGADYLLYGHIFPTDSKRGLAPRGCHRLQEVISQVSIPVIAIGGITPEVTEKVFQTGASGIAVLSGVLLADDVKEAVRSYRKVIERSM